MIIRFLGTHNAESKKTRMVSFLIDDILAVVNIDGDGAANYGYWKELFRTLSVK